MTTLLSPAPIKRLLRWLDWGEPKFNVDGSAFNGPWGRPQNDGPALRAIALIHLATILIQEGEIPYVRSVLYDSALPTSSVIKTDLEYVASQWNQPSFDPWEEVEGDHFFTRMVQRRALIEGAGLASILGDSRAAQLYTAQAQAIGQAMGGFLDSSHSLILETINRVAGLDYKNQQSRRRGDFRRTPRRGRRRVYRRLVGRGPVHDECFSSSI